MNKINFSKVNRKKTINDLIMNIIEYKTIGVFVSSFNLYYSLLSAQFLALSVNINMNLRFPFAYKSIVFLLYQF